MRFLLLILIITLNSCKKEQIIISNTSSTASVWVTTSTQSKLLSKDSTSLTFEPLDIYNPGISIHINTDSSFQEIDGFGAALTGSSAYLIHKKMSPNKRKELLNELFSANEGIGISYLRITMGASDFSLEDYTYNDLQDGQIDLSLEKFTIEKDKEDLIPVLKEILNISPNIKIMATPWSAPAWMKDNKHLHKGSLLKKYFDVYSKYFVRYLKEYQKEGIVFDAISVQNEPLHTASYMSMYMTPEDQLDFMKNHLGPELEKENLKVKILIYDHNWDRPDYPLHILADKEAQKYISGTAFHAYGGQVEAMSLVHNSHPDKGLYFTEISGGSWATNFGDNMSWNMKKAFIGSTRNWSKNVLHWNLALDSNSGPKNGGCDDCRGVVTIKSDTTVDRNEEYYSIAHFSKFVKPGAKRIATNSVEGISNVAFKNPDGSIALIVQNDFLEKKNVNVIIDKQRIRCSQEPKSTATYYLRK